MNQLIPLQIYTNFNRNEMKNIGLTGNLGGVEILSCRIFRLI